MFDEVPEDSGQFVGHGGDGFGGAQPGFPSSKAFSQLVFAPPEALGGQPQRHGGAAFDVTGFDGDDFAAGDAIIRTKAQPGGETFSGGKTGDKIRPQFGKKDQGGVDLQAGYLRQVHATKPVEFGAGRKPGFIALGLAMAGGRRR